MADQITSAEHVKILKIELSSEKLSKSLLFAGSGKAFPIVAEFSIFENITLPYLTGNMILQDDQDIMRLIDLNGTERITIEYIIPDESQEAVSKTFIITSIAKQSRYNDFTNVIAFNMIEDIGYYNLVRKISKFYDGKGEQIISDIVEDKFKRKLDISRMAESFQSAMRYIIPYLSPFDAIKNVLGKMTTTFGMPYFFFSSVSSNDLILTDLESIIKTEPFNKNNPFVYSQAVTNSTSMLDQMMAISSFEGSNLEDTLLLAQKGALGSRYVNINITTGELFDEHIDMLSRIQVLIDNELIDPIYLKSFVDNNDTFIVDPSGENIDRLTDFDSRVISDVSSVVFPNDVLNSLGQQEFGLFYSLRMVKNYLLDHITRNVYRIYVPGLMFLQKSELTSVGSQIEINVLRTTPQGPEHQGKGFIDVQRSGNYLILAKRHIFNVPNQTHNVSLEISRLTNQRDEN